MDPKLTLLVPRVSQSLSWKLTLDISALCFSFPVSNFQKVPYSYSLQRKKRYFRQVKEYLFSTFSPSLPINKILKTKFWIWFLPCGSGFLDNNVTLFIQDSFPVILVSECENFYWSCPSVLVGIIALKLCCKIPISLSSSWLEWGFQLLPDLPTGRPPTS